MNNVNKTLYIPLYGKAYVSRKSLFLDDKMAEKIWNAESFEFRGHAKSRWLSYYMGIRSAVFDDWTREKMAEMSDASVIHIGCGLDSRVLRIEYSGRMWYDVDFPDVINERKRYYSESANYRMIEGDLRDPKWLDIIDTKAVIVVMEGVGMYIVPEELKQFISALDGRFDNVALLLDCYSTFGARASKYRNPINEVGVTEVYGIDEPKCLENGALKFVTEHNMTPKKYIDELCGIEKQIFKNLYAGGISKKIYRLFEYKK